MQAGFILAGILTLVSSVALAGDSSEIDLASFLHSRHFGPDTADDICYFRGARVNWIHPNEFEVLGTELTIEDNERCTVPVNLAAAIVRFKGPAIAEVRWVVNGQPGDPIDFQYKIVEVYDSDRRYHVPTAYLTKFLGPNDVLNFKMTLISRYGF